MKEIFFLFLAALTLLSAAGVSFSRRIVSSGFFLLGTFAGAAGLFAMLSSDFLAVTQILIYVGGVMVLVLFAIMLTHRIGEVNLTNPSVNRKAALPVMAGLAIFLISLLTAGLGPPRGAEVYRSMVVPIGNALLKEYLLPFEVISLVLLGALVGAVVIVRREVK